MSRRGSLHGADALAHGGPRRALLAVFIGDDVKRGLESAQEFAGRQQEVRVSRAAETLVTLGKRFEDDDAARREAADDVREVRAMEIIATTMPSKASSANGQGPFSRSTARTSIPPGAP
ncbi:MAG: hypothetical protein AB7E79_04520 [Rhodospirillaceae bacterium]